MKHLMEKMDSVAKGLLNEAPKAPKEDPVPAYNKHLAKIKLWYKIFGQEIDIFSKKKDITWADEGSLNKVAYDFEELLKFINRGVK